MQKPDFAFRVATTVAVVALAGGAVAVSAGTTVNCGAPNVRKAEPEYCACVDQAHREHHYCHQSNIWKRENGKKNLKNCEAEQLRNEHNCEPLRKRKP